MASLWGKPIKAGETALFAGFSDRLIETRHATIRTRVAGNGPPLLLLHGYPQTHMIWHRIADDLATHFTVVATDLRGYGGSSKPPGGADHFGYSKRAMAADQVEVMAALGFERFQVVGHDRGGRVAHRMALDHTAAVQRVAVLDIVPTLTMFERADQHLARANYHWFFLAQPPDLPEHLIGLDPEFFLRWTLQAWTKIEDAIPEPLVQHYLEYFRDPGVIRASCEDYRAGASIDLDHDIADRQSRIQCPLLVLWGALGRVHRLFNVLETWREKGVDVRGRPVHSGHFVPEEAPDECLAELLNFLEH
jgi:haloacetate dehalogenase